ncbi:MAG: hypothetical protein IJE29_04310 [Firmicutes bacterium]|nr:hypothetical protein [Bacillota bacterium]
MALKEELSTKRVCSREQSRKVRLQNAVNLLEYTDAELRDLLQKRCPQLDVVRINCMHKEEMVDLLCKIDGN